MPPWWLGLCLGMLVGCAADRSQMDRTLMRDNGNAARRNEPVQGYVVHCPDVLSVHITGRRDLTGSRPIGTDGRIDMGAAGRLRVEGKTLPDVELLVAQVAFVSPRHVKVSVAEFKSQQIYLFGQVIGLQRAVPFQGQETVVDVLQRVGGITAGAASNDVYVVRPHLDNGKQPEVFHIDLKAILERTDEHTNIRVQPFDEIYVGETRQSCLEKCIPRWLRPLYESLCGLSRHLPFADRLGGDRLLARNLTMGSRQNALGPRADSPGRGGPVARGNNP